MGKLAEIKTKETQESVTDFINKIDDEQKRKDCFQIITMMEKATGDKAKLWGTSIIGFGNLIYASPKTQREVEWFKLGFSPRKTNPAKCSYISSVTCKGIRFNILKPGST